MSSYSAVGRTNSLRIEYDGKEDQALSNSNEYRFRIITTRVGGQPFLVDGIVKDRCDITIVGDWEADDFFDAIRKIAKKYRRAQNAKFRQDECTICNAPYGKCNCWTPCSCGWSFEKGTKCGNPIHKKKPPGGSMDR
jgi:hypothetical protein